MNEIEQRTGIDALSRREAEVLELLIEGCSLADVARRLERSEKTIQKHRDAIYRKLGVRNRMQLARATFGKDSVSGDARRAEQAWELIHSIESRLQVTGCSAESLLRAIGGAMDASAAALSSRTTGHAMWHDGTAPSDGAASAIRRSVEEETECLVPRDAASHLDEPELARCEIESCAAVRLVDGRSGHVGTLWIGRSKPIDDEAPVLEILRIYGRVLAERLPRAEAAE